MPLTTKTYNGLRLSFQNGVGGIHQQYQVTLDAPPTDDPGSLFTAALNALGFSYTSPHPTVRGLYASSFDGWCTVNGDPASISRADVTLDVGWTTPTFVPVGGVKVELSGSNSQTVLNRWPNGPQKGQPILVGYDRTNRSFNFPDQIAPDYVGVGKILGQAFDTVEIPIEAPNAILQLTRTEFAFPEVNFSLRRRLNTKKWLGFDPGTVLYRDLLAANMVGAGTIIPDYWTCKYVFEIAPDPTFWQKVNFFRNEHTGKLIEGVDITSGSNNGYNIVDPYGDAVDLNLLKFAPDLLK